MEEKILEALKEIKQGQNELKRELREEIKQSQNELREEFKQSQNELREELEQNQNELKQELVGNMSAITQRLKRLENEVKELKEIEAYHYHDINVTLTQIYNGVEKAFMNHEKRIKTLEGKVL